MVLCMEGSAPWDLVADGYVAESMAMLRPYSVDAIAALDLARTDHVLDVACGPGTTVFELGSAVARVTAIDFSDNMVAHLQRGLDQRGWTHVVARVMDGQSLEFPDDSFDACVSMFGLLFFPDRARGLAEVRRVLRPGGRFAMSSWPPLVESELMSALIPAFAAAVPEMPANNDPLPLGSLEALSIELMSAGFDSVRATRMEHRVSFDTVEDAWRLMEKGALPVVKMANQLGPEEWSRRRVIAMDYLRDTMTFPAALMAPGLLAVAAAPTRED